MKVAREVEMYQNRTDRDHRVVHAPCLVDITCLEGQLKTTAPHAEAHRV